MDAVALVKIPHLSLTQSLRPNPEAGPDAYVGVNALDVRIVSLDDGVLALTPFGFDTEPDELALGLRKLLGDALDAHDDARGIYVFPSVARPRARTYEGVIDELGELGMWVPRVSLDNVPTRVAEAPADSFKAQVQDLMARVGPDTIGRLEQAVASGDASAMAALQEQIMEAMAAHGGIDALERSLSELLASEGLSMEDLQAQIATMTGEQANFADMMRRAQEEMEELRRTDPARYAEIERAMLETFGKKP